MAFELKRNDLLPRWRVQLLQSDPSDPESTLPVDLTSATGYVFTMKSGSTTKVNKAAMSAVNAAQGLIEYAWMSGDTDVSGTYNAEVEVDWGGYPQTFPSVGYFTILITDDLA